ncbi:MAG: hypothetical protein D4R84_04955 [Rhodocyclaceae bacterium]|nr:MAG: hypothetical protein D4R84_04955 [Rhodocyclaceae bacterium]
MLDANTIALLNQLGINAADLESLLWGASLLTGLTILAAIPTAIIAKGKGRSRGLWLLFALSIPVIPLLLIWLLPAVPADPPPQQENRE